MTACMYVKLNVRMQGGYILVCIFTNTYIIHILSCMAVHQQPRKLCGTQASYLQESANFSGLKPMGSNSYCSRANIHTYLMNQIVNQM